MRTGFRTLALVSLLLLGAVACDRAPAADAGRPATNDGSGGGEPGTEAEAILQQASRDLSQESVVATFEFEVEAAGERVVGAGEMTVDPPAERASMSLELDGMPEMASGMRMDMVIDGTTLYMRSEVFPDGGWFKFDAGQAGLGGSFDGSGQMDPSVFLDFLRGADGIDVVGTEEIRGVETTHFAGKLDLSELVAMAPDSAERQQAQETIEGLEATLGEFEPTFDAWVDSEGVPWRVSFGFEPEGVDGSFTMTVDVLEIGGPVDIDVPSGEDVTDLGAMGAPATAA